MAAFRCIDLKIHFCESVFLCYRLKTERLFQFFRIDHQLFKTFIELLLRHGILLTLGRILFVFCLFFLLFTLCCLFIQVLIFLFCILRICLIWLRLLRFGLYLFGLLCLFRLCICRRLTLGFRSSGLRLRRFTLRALRVFCILYRICCIFRILHRLLCGVRSLIRGIYADRKCHCKGHPEKQCKHALSVI